MVIDVILGRGDDRAGAIGAVAARLGVQIDPHPGNSDETQIGGVTVASDALEWLIEAALIRALEPRHILFLCVANSARSQLAEGIARHLARGGVKISSAGSAPTSVRPEAVAVLHEIDIDISGQTSTGLDEVERPVDAVITLCGEEVCPVWLEAAWRLHWALPDPAAVEGSGSARLDAFRSVRDELQRRLSVLFENGPSR